MQLDRKTLAFGQLPSSKGDLYVPVSGRKGFAHNVLIHNTNTTAESVVLNFHDGTSEHQVLSQDVAAGDTLFLEFPGEGEVVDEGAKFTGNTTTASKVTFKFSGTEEIPDAVAAGGGSGSLLWEWNGIDVSQFSDGAGNPSSGYSSPNGTIAAATIASPNASSYRSNVIKYSYTGGDSNAAAWFAINDLPELPERYLVRAVIGPRDNGVGRAGEDTSPGLVVAYQDATHNVRVSRAASPTTQFTMWMANNSDGVDNVRYVAGPTGNLNNDGGTLVMVHCIMTDPDTGVDPSMILRLEGDSGSANVAYGVGTTWSAVGSPPAVWDSSWQSGGSFKNLGVWFQELGTAGTGYVADMKIYEV